MSAAFPSLFASSRHAKAYGLLLAGSILFVVGIGGSGALVAAYTGAMGPTAVAHVHLAV